MHYLRVFCICSGLWCLWWGLLGAQEKRDLRYGLLNITLSANQNTRLSIERLDALDVVQKTFLPPALTKAHKSRETYVLPFGTYRLRFTSQGYQDFVTNIQLSKEVYRLRLKVNMKLLPLQLTFDNMPYGTEIYLNRKYIDTFLDVPLTMSNVTGGDYQLLLIHGKFFYRRYLSSFKNPLITISNPRLTHYPSQVALTTTLGLLPGMNLLSHRPRSDMEMLLAFSILFYTSLGIILSQNTDKLIWLSPAESSLNEGTMYLILISSSLIHAFFVYRSTLEDIKEILMVKR